MTARAAAMYTLKLLRGDKANAALESFAAHDDLRELALRALCDRKNDVTVPAEPFLKGLTDANPHCAWSRRGGLAGSARLTPPVTSCRSSPIRISWYRTSPFRA